MLLLSTTLSFTEEGSLNPSPRPVAGLVVSSFKEAACLVFDLLTMALVIGDFFGDFTVWDFFRLILV